MQDKPSTFSIYRPGPKPELYLGHDDQKAEKARIAYCNWLQGPGRDLPPIERADAILDLLHNEAKSVWHSDRYAARDKKAAKKFIPSIPATVYITASLFLGFYPASMPLAILTTLGSSAGLAHYLRVSIKYLLAKHKNDSRLFQQTGRLSRLVNNDLARVQEVHAPLIEEVKEICNQHGLKGRRQRLQAIFKDPEAEPSFLGRVRANLRGDLLAFGYIKEATKARLARIAAFVGTLWTVVKKSIPLTPPSDEEIASIPHRQRKSRPPEATNLPEQPPTESTIFTIGDGQVFFFWQPQRCVENAEPAQKAAAPTVAPSPLIKRESDAEPTHLRTPPVSPKASATQQHDISAAEEEAIVIAEQVQAEQSTAPQIRQQGVYNVYHLSHTGTTRSDKR